MNPRHYEEATNFANRWLRANGHSLPRDTIHAKFQELRQTYLGYVRKGYVRDDYYSVSPLKRVAWLPVRLYHRIRFAFKRWRYARRFRCKP